MTSLIWVIVVVLSVLWLLGVAFNYGGSLVFLLLLLAIAGVVYNLLEGRIYGGTRHDDKTREATEVEDRDV